MSQYHERPNAQSQHVSRRRKASRLLFLLVLGGASLLAVPASAVNLVLNGNFESTSGGSSGQIGNAGFSVTDWTATYLSGSLGQPFAMVGPMSQFSDPRTSSSTAVRTPPWASPGAPWWSRVATIRPVTVRPSPACTTT